MIKKFILSFIFLLISNFSFAVNTELNFLNQDAPSGPQVQCDENTIQQCAIDLCGPAVPENYRFGFTPIPTEQGNENNVSPAIQTRIRQAITANLERNKRIIENLRSTVAQAQFQLGFQSQTNFQSNYLANYLFEPFTITEVDLTKPLSERVALSFRFPPGTSEEMMAGVRSFGEAKKNYMITDTDAGLENNIYSMNEMRDIAREQWKTLKSLPPGRNKKTELDVLNSRVMQVDSLDENEVRFLLYKLSEAKKRAITSPRVYPRLCPSGPCERALNISLLQDGKINAMIDRFEVATQNLTLIEPTINRCLSTFADNPSLSQQTQLFRDQLPQIIEQFISKSMDGFSQHSKDAFKSYLQEIHFNFGSRLSPEARLTAFEEFVARPISITDPFSTLTRFVNPISLVANPFRDLYLCSDYASPILADQFVNEKGGDRGEADDMPGRDDITVSEFTCTHAERGRQTLAHEIGHALSHAFKKVTLSETSLAKFLSMRSCVTQSHPSQGFPDVYRKHTGDNEFSEEDMADLLGYRFEPEGRPIACAYLFVNRRGTQYEDLSLSSETGGYSAPYLRLLKEASFPGNSLPASCQTVKSSNPQINFNSCQ